jgi:diaminopropionate ammonia-lyase
VFLHHAVPASRAARIAAEGAEIVWVQGTYDDAVDAAAAAARSRRDILVADTTDDPDDLVVGDVMAGYGVIAAEIRQQMEASGAERPTHVFVQAGVGGLAAAIAAGLTDWLAEMLSCGEASAPALAVLRRHGALAMTVPEAELDAAPAILREAGGPATTPSGATGLAGLLQAAASHSFGLNADSRVLILVTEAALEEGAA